MGYLHINNLYKDRTILLFRECYALEKIHGTSAHVSYDGIGLHFFNGGENRDKFLALFNAPELLEKFKVAVTSPQKVTVYGEAYGGKQQAMSGTYGKETKFVAFDVKIGDCWLCVPAAEKFCQSLGIEFVQYNKVPTDIATLDSERDSDSVQAIRNGVGSGKKREGVVLRPLVELTLNNGDRVICKHKRYDFRETKTPRTVDQDKLKVLEEASAVADEWVTLMRLEHVLQKIPNHSMETMRQILDAMVEDVTREAAGEIVDSPAVRKSICSKTAQMYKEQLKNSLVAV